MEASTDNIETLKPVTAPAGPKAETANAHAQHPAYEVILRADTSWLALELTGLWQFRDLLSLMVWRDFISKYKQTILGPLWFIIQPVLMTLVFTVIFGTVAKLSTDGLPPMLFYLCGQLGWNYFSQVFGINSATLLNNAGLFSKVYFPRLVVPLATLISNLLTFVIQLGTFFAFFVYFKYVLHSHGFGFDWKIVLLPLIVIQTGIFSLGISLIMSAFTAKYRDLIHLTPLLLQVWMYASAVIIPLSQFPQRYRWIVTLNPMTVITESYRLVLLGTGTVTTGAELYSIGVSIVLLLFGIVIFGKVEKTFVDTV